MFVMIKNRDKPFSDFFNSHYINMTIDVCFFYEADKECFRYILVVVLQYILI